MPNINKELHDLLAEARAIRLAMVHGAISYEDAKKRINYSLEKLNIAGANIAKKYGVKYKKITFQTLGKNLFVTEIKDKNEAKMAKKTGVSVTKKPF